MPAPCHSSVTAPMACVAPPAVFGLKTRTCTRRGSVIAPGPGFTIPMTTFRLFAVGSPSG